MTQPALQFLHELDPGTKFQVAGLPDLTGVVVRHTPGGSTVDYDRSREVEIATEEKTVKFSRRERAVISSHTVVLAR
jgi:cytochrome c1